MRIKRIVWQNRANGQKCVTIPSCADIQSGDAVWIEKVKTKVSENEEVKAEKEQTS